MLAAKILQPDANQDYLTVSGKLPDILKNLLKRISLDSVFTVDSSDASTLSNWMFQNPRYVDAYTGFRNLLASCGRRLDFQAKDNHILLGITPVGIIDNTIDSDLVDFKAETNRRAVNHLIGLGSQELKNRLVVNYFADATGVVSQTQTLVGADEVCATYDYSNADLGTLQSETKKHLQELQTGGSVEVTLSDEVGDGLRVDDKIVATDQTSGVNVTAVVTKRIVKIDSGILTSTFEVGLPVQSANANYSGSSSSSSSSGGSAGGGVSLTAGRGLSISGGTINADVASEDLDSVRQVAESANKTASGFAAQIGKANQTAEDAKNVADAAKTVADSAKSGMMTDGERSKLASVEQGANAYTLPKASTDVLGGVRVDGSSIVSVDGVISAHVGDGASGRIVFPIGYVVQNTTGIDPSVDFGGTWRQLPSLGCSMFERIG
nr:MAG TPA: hypothetical protein [Caudoviricetes sp.]